MVGDFSPKHILSADDRTLLQGFSDVLQWPSHIVESKRRAMVAQCVPPPFAEALSESVFGYQKLALGKARLVAKLCALAEASEQESERGIELEHGWLSRLGDDGGDDLMQSRFSFTAVSQPTEVELGKHGKWKCLGEYGWGGVLPAMGA